MSLVYATHLLEKIAHGDIPGISNFLLNGRNDAITTTAETIWDNTNLYVFRTTAVAMTISSGNANDAAAGTGARTVLVSGVDGSYAVSSETVTLNGQTAVTLANTYLSINSLTVATAGSGGKNAGIIYVGTGTVTAGVPATVDAIIAAGNNITTSAIYTVPASRTLIIKRIFATSRSTTAGGHEISIETIQSGGNSSGLPVISYLNGFNNGTPLDEEFLMGLKISAKTQLQCKVLAGAGTGPAYCVLEGFLINDSNKEIFS